MWDSRNLNPSLSFKTVDSSTGVLTPLFDDDTNLLFLASKGDGTVRFLEITEKNPYYLDYTSFVNEIPTKSIAMAPKRALDVMDIEVARLYKLTANSVVPIRYNVPRRVRRSSGHGELCNDHVTHPPLRRFINLSLSPSLSLSLSLSIDQEGLLCRALSRYARTDCFDHGAGMVRWHFASADLGEPQSCFGYKSSLHCITSPPRHRLTYG